MAKEAKHIGQLFIQVNGSDLTPDLLGQLDDAIVEDDLAQPAMFVLRFNDSTLKLLDGNQFLPGHEVKIAAAGPDGNSGVLLIGEITAIEPTLEQHNLTLTVRGYDRSHRLYRGVHTRTYLNKTDDDIVKQIAREAGLSAEVTPVGVMHRYLIQHNQTDMEFLRGRAIALGYRVAVLDRTLQFHPADRELPAAPPLDYGSNLLSFRARLTSVAQANSVQVRGWDPSAKRPIVGTSKQPSRVPKINNGASAAQVAQKAFGSAAEVIVGDRPVSSQEEAERMARSILDHMSGQYLAAEGYCLGMTALRAGTTVAIKSIGDRLSGSYFISATRHEYTAAKGYMTSFSVNGRRPTSLLDHVYPQATSAAQHASVAVGVVTNVDDPDKLGRVRLTFPWLDEAHESNWARLALPWAGPQRGIFAALEIHDEVLVAFEHGDLNRPYVIGALWNGKDQPPEAAVKPGRKLVLIQTADGQVVTLDDLEQKLTLTAGDHTVTLDKKRKQLTLTSGDAKITLDQGSQAINVETSGELMLKGAGGSLAISQSGVELKSSGTLKIDASSLLDLTTSAVMNIKGSLVKIN